MYFKADHSVTLILESTTCILYPDWMNQDKKLLKGDHSIVWSWIMCSYFPWCFFFDYRIPVKVQHTDL